MDRKVYVCYIGYENVFGGVHEKIILILDKHNVDQKD